MFRRMPNSDTKRSKALDDANTKANATPVAARLISTESYTKLGTLLPQWKTAVGTRGTSKSGESAAVNAQSLALGKTRQLISHFIQNLNNAIERGTFPASVRAFYQLDVGSARVPVLSSRDDVLLWGDRLATGETARVAAGGQPLAFPAIGEVNTAVADLQAKGTSESGTTDELKGDQKAVITLRPQVDALIHDMWDEVEFALRKEPHATMRAKAREWGLVYDSHPGEPPTPPPATTTK